MRCHLYCEGQNPAAVQKTYSRNNGIDEVLLNPNAFRYEGCELQLVDIRALREKGRVDGTSQTRCGRRLSGITRSSQCSGPIHRHLLRESGASACRRSGLGRGLEYLSASKVRSRSDHPRGSDASGFLTQASPVIAVTPHDCGFLQNPITASNAGG